MRWRRDRLMAMIVAVSVPIGARLRIEPRRNVHRAQDEGWSRLDASKPRAEVMGSYPEIVAKPQYLRDRNGFCDPGGTNFLDMYARAHYGVLHFEQKCLRTNRTNMEFVQ